MNEKFEEEQMLGIEGEERQAFASILLMHRMIEEMKQAGVYDNTLIVITADHGCSRQITSTLPDYSQVNRPLLLIKKPEVHRDEMLIHETYTNIQDITPTILTLLGLEVPEDKFSVYNVPDDVLARRAKEYENFWTEKRLSKNLPTIVLSTETKNVMESSSLVLKRASLRLENKNNQLSWFVGDDPDTWDKKVGINDARIVLRASNQSGAVYTGTVRMDTNDTASTRNVFFWSSYGIIDTSNLPDGEYDAVFLLPKADGTYARCLIPETVSIAGGVAKKLGENPQVMQAKERNGVVVR